MNSLNKKNTTKCEHPFNVQGVKSRCRNKNCDGCRTHYVRHWSLRCAAEGETALLTLFVTLTLSDEHLDLGIADPLEPFKGYIARLRYAGRRDGFAVRYLACFETGDRTDRPHWHAILFFREVRTGAKLPEFVLNVRLNQKFWPYGFSQYELPHTHGGMVSYTFGYISKKGGVLFRPSNGIGRAYLMNYAEMLGRNRRPFMADQFGVRVRVASMTKRKRGKLAYAGQKRGAAITFLLEPSHPYAQKMVHHYRRAWSEAHGDEPDLSWLGWIKADL